jgi:hypothetical protein
MTFRDLEVFNVRPHYQDVLAGQMDDLQFNAGGFGLATPWRESGATRRTVKLPFALRGLDAIGELRRFFDRHRGRQIPCWVPAWVNDFEIFQDALGAADELILVGTGFYEKFQLGGQFKFIALLTRAGKLECYGVHSAVQDGGNTEIVLDREIDSDVIASQTVCCPLLLARSTSDDLEYDYLAGNVIRGEINWVECPQEYPGTAAEDSAADTAHLGSRPVFLYRIGDGVTTLTLADYGVDVEAASLTWEAADISGDNLTSALDMLGDTLTARLKTDDPDHALLDYQDRLNARNFTCEVFLADMDNLAALDLAAPDHIGRIEEVRFGEQGAIEIEVSSLFRFAETRIPKYQMQRLANGSVYDHVTEATYTTAGTIDVISADPAYVEVSEFGDKATAESDADWFALGKVVCGDEIRLCTGQDGNRLYLNYPFARAVVTDAISAVAGDDKRIGTWDAKFGALEEFTGFPGMPSRNPAFMQLKAPQAGGGKK